MLSVFAKGVLPFAASVAYLSALCRLLWGKHEGDGMQLTLTQSMTSGFSAACLGPVCTGPFDVIKVQSAICLLPFATCSLSSALCQIPFAVWLVQVSLQDVPLQPVSCALCGLHEFFYLLLSSI